MKGEKYKEWLPKRLPNKMVIQTILYKSYSYMVKKEIGMRVFFILWLVSAQVLRQLMEQYARVSSFATSDPMF